MTCTSRVETATLVEDAYAENALAGGLTIPEGLEGGEVSPVDEEEDERDEGDCPVAGGGSLGHQRQSE